MDVRPESKTLTVYSCFANHCSPAADNLTTCDAHNGTGCCFEGRTGLLCESCIDGFVKQSDKCIPCEGAAWDEIVTRGAIKTVMILLVCAKLLEKASARTYMSTTAFATVIFTLQTVALAASDSYGTLLQSEWPAFSEFLDIAQSLLNPDRQTPEKCLFEPSLSAKFIVEAVLPPVSALGMLGLISVPWHCCSFSCGAQG